MQALKPRPANCPLISKNKKKKVLPKLPDGYRLGHAYDCNT